MLPWAANAAGQSGSDLPTRIFLFRLFVFTPHFVHYLYCGREEPVRRKHVGQNSPS